MKKTGWIGSVAFILLLVAGFTPAEEIAVPAAVNYEGRLTDPSDGNPVPPGVYHLEFRIWDDPTDTGAEHLIWGRSFPVHVMPGGVFNIVLSDDGMQVTAPSPQINDLKQAFQGEYRYLGITITHGPNGDLNLPEISPRQWLVSSPFAFHAQNATHASHAKQADEARLAQDTEKLGGTDASEFYNNARFASLGLSGDCKTLLGWTSGGIAGATKLYDYAGNFSVADSPTQPDSGVKFLVKDGKIQADDGLIANGPVRLSSGEPNQGLQFPENIGGGSGDKAYLQYYVRTNAEDCTLELAVENDSEDDIELRASGDIKLKAGGVINMQGNLSVFDGMTLAYDFWREDGNNVGDSYEVIAPSDGFYYVNYSRVRIHLTLGPVGWDLIQSGTAYRTEAFPIAKGETFKVKLLERYNEDNSYYWLKIYWRPFCKQAD